jgi:hypothetical protein
MVDQPSILHSLLKLSRPTVESSKTSAQVDPVELIYPDGFKLVAAGHKTNSLWMFSLSRKDGPTFFVDQTSCLLVIL